MATKAYSYIRFSSAEQANGASQKRQIERAEEYARKRGWELDKSLAIDKGVSAWTGANIHEGSFKKFLDLVEKGKIPKGSVLIVESLDRISRQHFLDALVPFKKILSRDITIVSLIDGQEYTKDSIKNDFQMWCCLLSFQLANNESDKKSVRVKDAWKRKRDNISKNILYTKMAPFWLQWSEKKNWWEPVPDKIKTKAKWLASIIHCKTII